MDDIIFDILCLCKKKELNYKEISTLKYIFENNIVDVNYDNGRFILSASFFGNYDMINILKLYGANIYVNEKKPYKLALQNNNIKCLDILR